MKNSEAAADQLVSVLYRSFSIESLREMLVIGEKYRVEAKDSEAALLVRNLNAALVREIARREGEAAL